MTENAEILEGIKEPAEGAPDVGEREEQVDLSDPEEGMDKGAKGEIPTDPDQPGGDERDADDEADAEDRPAGDNKEAPGEEEDDVSAAGDSPEKEKGAFFKKKKDKKDQQIEELTDRVKRQMAEFDNFRKRTEKEKASMYEVGVKSVIEKILPVVDNLERGLDAAEKGEDGGALAEGMEKIYRQFLTVLSDIGVEPIEALGKEFDPEVHNAVMHVEDEGLGENIVAEEFQKGYTYRGVVVRHSMVKVSN